MKENQTLSSKVVYLRTMLDKLSQLHGFSTQDIKVKLHDLEDTEKYPTLGHLTYQSQVMGILAQIQDQGIAKALKEEQPKAEQSLLVLQEIVSRINLQLGHKHQSQVYLNLRSSHHKVSHDSAQGKKLLKIQNKSNKQLESHDLAKSMDQIFSQLTPSKKIHMD